MFLKTSHRRIGRPRLVVFACLAAATLLPACSTETKESKQPLVQAAPDGGARGDAPGLDTSLVIDGAGLNASRDGGGIDAQKSGLDGGRDAVSEAGRRDGAGAEALRRADADATPSVLDGADAETSSTGLDATSSGAGGILGAGGGAGAGVGGAGGAGGIPSMDASSDASDTSSATLADAIGDAGSGGTGGFTDAPPDSASDAMATGGAGGSTAISPSSLPTGTGGVVGAGGAGTGGNLGGGGAGGGTPVATGGTGSATTLGTGGGTGGAQDPGSGGAGGNQETGGAGGTDLTGTGGSQGSIDNDIDAGTVPATDSALDADPVVDAPLPTPDPDASLAQDSPANSFDTCEDPCPIDASGTGPCGCGATGVDSGQESEAAAVSAGL